VDAVRAIQEENFWEAVVKVIRYLRRGGLLSDGDSSSTRRRCEDAGRIWQSYCRAIGRPLWVGTPHVFWVRFIEFQTSGVGL